MQLKGNRWRCPAGTHGFSLLEVVVVVALMGMTSLITSEMMVNSMKAQRYVTLKYAYQSLVNEVIALFSSQPGCGTTLAATNSSGTPNFATFTATPVPSTSPAMMAYDIPLGIFYPAPTPSVTVTLPSGNIANYYYQSSINTVIPQITAPDSNNAIGYYGGPTGLQVTQAQIRYSTSSAGTIIQAPGSSYPNTLWLMYLYLQGQAFSSQLQGGHMVLSGPINAIGPQYFESSSSVVNMVFDGNVTTNPIGAPIIACIGGATSSIVLAGGSVVFCPAGYFPLNGGCGDCTAYLLMSEVPGNNPADIPAAYNTYCH